MKLYRTREGPVLDEDGSFVLLEDLDWDSVFLSDDAGGLLRRRRRDGRALEVKTEEELELLAPVGGQEVWAAGVTYRRSREARKQESAEAGGGDFYDRVYRAERPELFLKATPHRVVGHREGVHVRSDSRWNVPEPELTLAVNRGGRIFGYTVGNDLSSRDIEGENPLYLPQAKVFDRCCALGPGLLISEEPLPPETAVRMEIRRLQSAVFSGETVLSEMRKSPRLLVRYLFRDNSFPLGCLLLTGTGIVPDDDFSLQAGDEIRIEIPLVGTLINRVER